MATRILKQSKLADYFVSFDSDNLTKIQYAKKKEIKIDNVEPEVRTSPLNNGNNNAKVKLLSMTDDKYTFTL